MLRFDGPWRIWRRMWLCTFWCWPFLLSKKLLALHGWFVDKSKQAFIVLADVWRQAVTKCCICLWQWNRVRFFPRRGLPFPLKDVMCLHFVPPWCRSTIELSVEYSSCRIGSATVSMWLWNGSLTVKIINCVCTGWYQAPVVMRNLDSKNYIDKICSVCRAVSARSNCLKCIPSFDLKYSSALHETTDLNHISVRAEKAVGGTGEFRDLIHEVRSAGCRAKSPVSISDIRNRK